MAASMMAMRSRFSAPLILAGRIIVLIATVLPRHVPAAAAAEAAAITTHNDSDCRLPVVMTPLHQTVQSSYTCPACQLVSAQANARTHLCTLCRRCPLPAAPATSVAGTRPKPHCDSRPEHMCHQPLHHLCRPCRRCPAPTASTNTGASMRPRTRPKLAAADHPWTRIAEASKLLFVPKRGL
jgi:hypothetical protein